MLGCYGWAVALLEWREREENLDDGGHVAAGKT